MLLNFNKMLININIIFSKNISLRNMNVNVSNVLSINIVDFFQFKTHAKFVYKHLKTLSSKHVAHKIIFQKFSIYVFL